jgi:hypothetical protein
MRQQLASGLCYASGLLTTVMAVLSGLGLTVTLIVLAATGKVGVGVALVIFFVGLPLIEGVAYLVTMGLALAMMGTAKLLDSQAVTEWLDRQEGY